MKNSSEIHFWNSPTLQDINRAIAFRGKANCKDDRGTSFPNKLSALFAPQKFYMPRPDEFCQRCSIPCRQLVDCGICLSAKRTNPTKFSGYSIEMACWNSVSITQN
jgi:hypothetical protein